MNHLVLEFSLQFPHLQYRLTTTLASSAIRLLGGAVYICSNLRQKNSFTSLLCLPPLLPGNAFFIFDDNHFLISYGRRQQEEKKALIVYLLRIPLTSSLCPPPMNGTRNQPTLPTHISNSPAAQNFYLCGYIYEH